MDAPDKISEVEGVVLLEQAKMRQRELKIIRGESRSVGELLVIGGIAVGAALLNAGAFGTLFACVVVMLFACVMELVRLKKRLETLVHFLEDENVIHI